MSLWEIFLSEFFGTTMLTLLGVGVVANNLLKNCKGNGGGWNMVSWGWGIGVFAGAYVGFKSGGHLNPAVTIGILINTLMNGGDEFVDGVPISVGSTAVYLVAEVLGGLFGAILAWLSYKQHYDKDLAPEVKLGTFATGPELRSYGWNFLTEVIATFVLVMAVLVTGYTSSGLGPLVVSLVVVGIGMSLGGPTGYAINPARDLGPRIAHAIIPIKGKGGSDWAYSWVPIAGPIVGAIIASFVAVAISF